jgi:hypothetical protein
VNEGCKVAIKIDPFMYPKAKVRQSAAGASAVMGSNMVLADMCSDVDGSNRITLPCELPEEHQYVESADRRRGSTKGNAGIFHPRCRSYVLIGGESGNLISCDHIPDNGCKTAVIADHQSPVSPIAHGVGCYPLYILPMLLKTPGDRQSIMLKA